MQLRTFVIHPGDSSAEEELNRFLRAKRILTVTKHFCDTAGGGWHICVEYLDDAPATSKATFDRGGRVDYRDVLNERDFARFCVLRECRKEIATSDAIPAFAVFLDEHLAEMAKMERLTLSEMVKINGIGAKKCEKFGERMLQLFEVKTNEASRKPVSPDSGNGQPATGVLESPAPQGGES